MTWEQMKSRLGEMAHDLRADGYDDDADVLYAALGYLGEYQDGAQIDDTEEIK